MEVKTKKIIGAVESVAVLAYMWQESTQKLGISEPEDPSSKVRENMREAYDYILLTSTIG